MYARAQNTAPLALDLLAGRLDYWDDVVAAVHHDDGLENVVAYTPYALPRAPIYDLTTIALGTHVRVSVDDVPVVTAQLAPGAASAAGGMGLVCDDPQVWFDDVWARRYTEPEPAATLGGPETSCP